MSIQIFQSLHTSFCSYIQFIFISFFVVMNEMVYFSFYIEVFMKFDFLPMFFSYLHNFFMPHCTVIAICHEIGNEIGLAFVCWSNSEIVATVALSFCSFSCKNQRHIIAPDCTGIQKKSNGNQTEKKTATCNLSVDGFVQSQTDGKSRSLTDFHKFYIK